MHVFLLQIYLCEFTTLTHKFKGLFYTKIRFLTLVIKPFIHQTKFDPKIYIKHFQNILIH